MPEPTPDAGDPGTIAAPPDRGDADAPVADTGAEARRDRSNAGPGDQAPVPAHAHAATSGRLVARLCVALVEAGRRFAFALIAAALALSALAGWGIVGNLGMNSDLGALLSEDVPWRQREARFDAAFPQLTGLLVIVVDGVTADLADDAAAALTARLAATDGLFHSVHRPDGEAFLRRHGLLYLSIDRLETLVDDIIEAQPFIGSLAADPSLRGLFGTLALGVEGVERGAARFERFEDAVRAIADTAAAVLDGRFRPLSWQRMLTGQQPSAAERRRLVIARPVRDFGRLDAAGAAMRAVRAAVADLALTPDNGVRVRLTGSVAIEKEELQTLADGAATSLTASLTLVTLLLVIGLGTARLIVPIVVTLLVGLVLTTGFATLAVGALNPISVAFAVLFLGLGVDFGIQFATRYRDERHRQDDPTHAIGAAAAGVGGSLLLAAAATAAGFFAFLPTAYVGVSELGLIAGVGMMIAVVLNLTLLPALLTLARPRGEPAPVGFARLAPADRWLARHRRAVAGVALALALAGLAAVPALDFDFNPMNLRDPTTESVATAHDLMSDPATTPFTIDILAPSLDAATALADRLAALPEVARVVTLESFVPADQDDKLAIIADAAFFLAPTLTPAETTPPPSRAEIRSSLADTAAALARLADEPSATRLARLLERAAVAPAHILDALDTALLSGLPARLDSLRVALSADQPVDLAALPPNLARDWRTEDGAARLLVSPAGDARDNRVLVRFVEAVRAIAPQATGTAVTIQASADTIVGAFLQAGATAIAVIALLLFATLRRLVDVVLVLAPMVLAAVVTTLVCVATGLALNFANIIALPLLFGIGVAFNIYILLGWRAGITGVLPSPTARAVLFSALTTLVAFGSLALSPHPGTASMGVLLMLSLTLTLIASLIALPALLGLVRPIGDKRPR